MGTTIGKMDINAEVISITPSILDPNDFMLKKSAVIKLRMSRMSVEKIVDSQAIGGDAEADLERQVGKEVLRAIGDAKPDYLIPGPPKT